MLKLFSNESLIPREWTQEGETPWCFNPALIRVNHQWVLCYRVILTDQLRRLAICRLDQSFNLIPNSALPLSDYIHFHPQANLSEQAYHWFADPRLFYLNDRLMLYFNSGWHDPMNHQCLIELDNSTLLPISRAKELVLEGQRQVIEKNWMIFGSEEIFGIYSSAPQVMMKITENEVTFRCEKIKTTHPALNAYADAYPLRGGCPPVLVNQHYYAFCHTVHPSLEGAEYKSCVYRFESTFPFKIDQLPNQALSLPNPMGRNRKLGQLNPAVTEVIYPCGAVFHDNHWILSYGLNDEQCAIVKLTQDEVDSTLEGIQ